MFIYPMLLEKEEKPFSDHNYLFELKLDGHRMIYSYENTKLQLFTRHFTDVTARYILNFIWANYKYISIPWLILNLAHLICAK